MIPSWNFFKHLISDKGELLATFPTGSDEDEVRNAVIQAMFGDYQRKTEL